MIDLYQFRQELMTRGVFFCFSGPISQNLVAEMGTTLEQKMHLEEAGKSTILRVFSIVVENAQNILHYSAEEFPADKGGKKAERMLRLGILAVGFEEANYFVHCGNMVENEKVTVLTERLNRLNAMSKDELKQHYRKQRKQSSESGEDSKGAGLGFIEMAKKASRPIEFDFKPIDDRYSFFSMKIII